MSTVVNESQQPFSRSPADMDVDAMSSSPALSTSSVSQGGVDGGGCSANSAVAPSSTSSAAPVTPNGIAQQPPHPEAHAASAAILALLATPPILPEPTISALNGLRRGIAPSPSVSIVSSTSTVSTSSGRTTGAAVASAAAASSSISCPSVSASLPPSPRTASPPRSCSATTAGTNTTLSSSTLSSAADIGLLLRTAAYAVRAMRAHPSNVRVAHNAVSLLAHPALAASALAPRLQRRLAAADNESSTGGGSGVGGGMSNPQLRRLSHSFRRSSHQNNGSAYGFSRRLEPLLDGSRSNSRTSIGSVGAGPTEGRHSGIAWDVDPFANASASSDGVCGYGLNGGGGASGRPGPVGLGPRRGRVPSAGSGIGADAASSGGVVTSAVTSFAYTTVVEGVICEAISNFPLSAAFQHTALAALQNMAKGDHGIGRAREPVIVATVHVMRRHPAHNGILVRAADVLAFHLNQPTAVPRPELFRMSADMIVASSRRLCSTTTGASAVLLACVGAARWSDLHPVGGRTGGGGGGSGGSSGGASARLVGSCAGGAANTLDDDSGSGSVAARVVRVASHARIGGSAQRYGISSGGSSLVDPVFCSCVVNAMRQHPNVVHVQILGCETVRVAGRTAGRNLVSSGAVDAVLAALERHPANIAVVDRAVPALRAVMLDKSPSVPSTSLMVDVFADAPTGSGAAAGPMELCERIVTACEDAASAVAHLSPDTSAIASVFATDIRTALIADAKWLSTTGRSDRRHHQRSTRRRGLGASGGLLLSWFGRRRNRVARADSPGHEHGGPQAVSSRSSAERIRVASNALERDLSSPAHQSSPVPLTIDRDHLPTVSGSSLGKTHMDVEGGPMAKPRFSGAATAPAMPPLAALRQSEVAIGTVKSSGILSERDSEQIRANVRACSVEGVRVGSALEEGRELADNMRLDSDRSGRALVRNALAKEGTRPAVMGVFGRKMLLPESTSQNVTAVDGMARVMEKTGKAAAGRRSFDPARLARQLITGESDGDMTR